MNEAAREPAPRRSVKLWIMVGVAVALGICAGFLAYTTLDGAVSLAYCRDAQQFQARHEDRVESSS